MTTSLAMEQPGSRTSLWTRLTEPHPSIQDVGERRRARLTSSLALALAIMALMTVLGSSLADPTVTLSITSLSSIGTMFALYGLSRSRHYQATAIILVAATIILIMLSIVTSSSSTIVSALNFLVLPLLLATILLPSRAIIVTIFVLVVFVLITPLINPSVPNTMMPLITIVISSGLLVVFLNYRNALERDRQAQLTSALRQAETANSALAQSQALLRSVIDNMPQSVVWKDRQSTYVGMNEQFVKDSGMDAAEQMIGKNDYDMPWKDRAPLYFSDDQAVMDADTPRLNYEEQLTRADGKEIWLRTSKVPMHVADGTVSGVVIIVEDITGRKVQEQEREHLIGELQTANDLATESVRLKSEFMSTMSHELRTPLNAIRGFTGIMLEGMGGEIDDEARHMLGRIDSNSGRLLGLINDLLDIAKIEAGRMELVNEALSPQALAERWRSLNSVLADQKGLKLDITIDPTLPDTFIGDAERITQIVTNLLSNAIKFTHKGRVGLALKRQSEQWILEVSDTGVGIPPHALNYIFDEFRQVDGSTKRAYGGSGLGLAIVRNLCRMMGGSVKVSSELGKGSVFTVTLPLVAARQTEAPILEIA